MVTEGNSCTYVVTQAALISTDTSIKWDIKMQSGRESTKKLLNCLTMKATKLFIKLLYVTYHDYPTLTRVKLEEKVMRYYTKGRYFKTY